MGWPVQAGLDVLHALYLTWTCLVALFYQPFVANPQPLETKRVKVPTNLALVLSSTTQNPSDDETEVIIESVVCAARWCIEAGIKGLSIYDRHGVVTKCAERIRASLCRDADRILPDSDGSDLEYSPSPSISDSSDSRSVSPKNWCRIPRSIITINLGADIPKPRRSTVKRRQANKALNAGYQSKPHNSHQMTLSLVSYQASKPFMAFLARSFAASGKFAKQSGNGKWEISVDNVESAVQDTLHLPPPDLMIVHPLEQNYICCPPLEFHGFPPWIMRLTEIYYDESSSLSRAWQSRNKRVVVALPEETFRRALDKYAVAEMRLGK